MKWELEFTTKEQDLKSFKQREKVNHHWSQSFKLFRLIQSFQYLVSDLYP